VARGLGARRRSVVSEYASIDGIVRDAMRAWKPPPKLSLSEWADEHFRLSSESAAEPGKWRTISYQRGIMDAFTDAAVTQVSVMKSARVGWTEIVKALVGYHIHHDPTTIMVVQPTVADAEGFSKEGIAPMLRDCPTLAEIIFEEAEQSGPRDSGNTILHKRFPGGVLSLVGANSGAGLRRVARRIVLFDEVDAYPPSAGSDGDPVSLGIRRSQTYWNRRIGAGSTPLISGLSRIEQLFHDGDQRYYFVPCPHCGHMARLVFSGDGGHVMTWPEGKPEEAFFTCQARGCVIEHREKAAMIAAGEWRATAIPKTVGHVTFHIWAAYSLQSHTDWKDIVQEFLKAKELGAELLKTFINTWLGETWKERGEAPEWERLYHRREQYEIGTVPAGVLVLTAGVDVQKDRWVYEVVGWGAGKESWSVDAGVIMGDPSNAADWTKVDELLSRTYPAADGVTMAVRCLAVDSGYNTNAVYSWARRHSMSRVIATKGRANANALIGSPSAVDVTVGGKKLARGYKVWIVGADMAKAELYGWLRLAAPLDGEPFPEGYCHFPEYGNDYFKQLTAEQLVSHVDKHGFTRHEWALIPGRENHGLDCRVLARAAATRVGLDRMRAPSPRPAKVEPVPPPEPRPDSVAPPATVRAEPRNRPPEPAPVRNSPPAHPRPGRGGRDSFLRRGKGWLKR
jgi:phage terminase large subunit GpA-like protein